MDIFDENGKTGQDFERAVSDGSADDLRGLKAWLLKENARLETERKRLKQDEIFFDKKMDILKNGFMQLDAERKQFEKEKMNFDARKHAHETYRRQEMETDTARLLFQGVKSQLALKKRYRDLLKMFHPDNIAGDHEMVLLINAVYEKLKKEYEFGKEA